MYKVKLYAIKFSGYYPVGAVALVWAPSQLEAIDYLLHKLLEMTLFHKNPRKDLEEACEFICETEQDKLFYCNILLDGEY